MKGRRSRFEILLKTAGLPNHNQVQLANQKNAIRCDYDVNPQSEVLKRKEQIDWKCQ